MDLSVGQGELFAVRAARKRAIERQVARLERRCAPLQVQSERVSWVRVAIFGVGIVVAVFAANQFGIGAGVGAAFGALALFAAVAWYHRRLECWIDTFTLWRAFRQDQLARLNLDWDRLTNFASARSRANPLAFDLDITGPRSLHQLMDTTLSRQASQLLIAWLTQTHPELDAVHTRQNITRELLAFVWFRERFTRAFRLVLRERLEGEPLLDWLALALPAERLTRAALGATGLVALNWVLLIANLWGGLPAWWLASLGLYFAFWLFNQSWLAQLFQAANRLDAELVRFGAIFDLLEHTAYDTYPHLADLCAPFRDPRHSPTQHTRAIRRVTWGVGLRSNPLVGPALNLLLPWDFLFALLIDRCRRQAVAWFPRWAQICYTLDAYTALANFAYVNPDYTFPTITAQAQPILSVRDLGHPLIPHARRVCNDFAFTAPGELALITGSNMAGKSTFLKTLGINLGLAYAGAPVAATRFVAVPFRMHTCIHITDSITDGFSYFYAEVQCLRHLLAELQTPHAQPLFYLVDEIFRGTNNRERLLGSRAYLQALLGANGVGLIATHDLELASLAEHQPAIHNWHFRDAVADGKLIFDYKLHPGPSATTNALKIMALAGLPIP